MYKPKINELRISRLEIARHCMAEWEIRDYIRNRLKEEGFSLDKPIVGRECFETMEHVFSQEIR